MKRWTWGLALGALLALAGPAWAVTVEDVIGLTRAGASDTIILSKIEADGTVFHVTVQEILDLKKAGVSDAVITYMINTGKGDDSVLMDETEVDAPAVDAIEDDYAATDSDRYSTGLDSRYRGSATVAFAYYYPHWPGYRWSYYYDPFWWPDLAYYFTYWQPYPYGYWYYDPWYRCHSRTWWYWGDGHYDHYAYAHHDHYDRYRKGRNVGDRGSAGSYDRSSKDRSASRPSYDASRRREMRPSPSPGAVREVKSDRPSVDRSRQLRQPRQPGSPAQEIDAPRPAPSRDVKPAPRPSQVREDRPSRDAGRSMRPTPAPSPRPSSPPPGNTREESRTRKH